MEKNNKHILIVDDDERIRSLLQQFLIQSDYLVSTAEDAEQARTLLSAIEFDLIILDVMMPGQNGYDLAKEIKLIKKSNCEIIPCSSKQYFTRALRPKNSILDTSRIENHLSLKILDWTNALDDCLKRIEGKNII